MLDSLTYCHVCKTPYVGELKTIASAHHQAKMRIVEKSLKRDQPPSKEELLSEVRGLAAVTKGLAVVIKVGSHLNLETIPQLFEDIRDE